GLPRSALGQIVNRADDYGAARSRVQSNADIAEIGARDAAQVRQPSGIVEANERFARVALLVDFKQGISGIDTDGAEVDGFENAGIEGQKLSSKAELALGESGNLEHFGNMAVVEHGISEEVLSDLAKTGVQRSLPAGSAHPRFGVADDTRSA